MFDERILYLRPRGRHSTWLSRLRRGMWREYLETKDAAPAKIACAVRPVIARGFSDLDFRGLRLLTGPSSLRFPIPLCRLSSDPPSRGVFSPLRCSSALHPWPSRVRVALRLACSYANRGAMSRYFIGFILGNIWWRAGMRTKGTCSLRKSSRRRQEGGSRTRLGLFTCS